MGSIQLKDVRKAFGAVSIINGVNLNIENGEFAVFVGPSGCGKSTLLRLIAGLEDVTSGQVSGDKVVLGINRAKLNGAMVARVMEDNKSMNITISVKVADQMIPVIGLTLARNVDSMAVGSIKP